MVLGPIGFTDDAGRSTASPALHPSDALMRAGTGPPREPSPTPVWSGRALQEGHGPFPLSLGPLAMRLDMAIGHGHWL